MEAVVYRGARTLEIESRVAEEPARGLVVPRPDPLPLDHAALPEATCRGS